MNDYKSEGDTEWICKTCNQNLLKGEVPKMSVYNKMGFPAKPPELHLHQLEERLIALRIPFMQIRKLPRGGQISITGNIVNVPADVETTVAALPRITDESVTVPVKLKRRMSFNRVVLSENIRPNKVFLALRWLMHNSELYKASKIEVDYDWIETVSAMQSNLPQDPDSPETDQHDSTEAKDCDSDNFSEIDATEIVDEQTLLDEAEPSTDHVYTVAPGEGQKPLGLFRDTNSEYLAFPTIFCGQTRAPNSEREKHVHYSDICKWELRSVDRRVALSIPKILYKSKA